MTAIRIDGISKTFDKEYALRDVSFDVAPGELFGLIGPDGAGKTTLFKILTTLLIPDKGEAWVEGFHTVKDFKKIRKIIGYMPGRFSLYQDLSVEENLHFFATIFKTSIEENYDLIRDIYEQIKPFKKRRAGNLSGGMKQKLALCCALIHQPQVLFLDEPTTGVDAVSRAEFWEMLGRLKEKGITILVSTPYMDEATLCEKIALIQGGKILQIDTPQAISQAYPRPLYQVRCDEYYALLQDLREQSFAESVEPFGEFLHVTTDGSVSEDGLSAYLHRKAYKGIEVEPIPATVEDVFLELLKKETG